MTPIRAGRKYINNLFFDERGVVALATTTIVLLVGSALVFSIALIFLNRVEAARNFGRSEQAYFIAEAGIEDYLLRYLDPNKDLPASMPYTVSLGNAIATIQQQDISATVREVTSDGNASLRRRKLRVLVTTNTTGTSFFYGAQVGNGGLTMQNGSRVEGNVYSNGPISGSNSPDITNDVFVAGTNGLSGVDIGGNAQARSITNTTVSRDARANALSQCTVQQNAYYGSSITNCTVSGSQTQQAYTNLPALPMPISDQTIDGWKQQAEQGGVINCSGKYQPADGAILGPVKINCDLEISGNIQVTMRGYIWVVGTFTIKNQAILRLDSSFGPLSSVLIADDPNNRSTKGIVLVQNNSQALGSGTQGSYIMLAAMNNNAESGGTTKAIEISNGSNSSIFYAPHGSIEIQNNVNLVEVTGYKLELENSAVVQYQQGLSNTQFSGGPSGGISITTWEEQ